MERPRTTSLTNGGVAEDGSPLPKRRNTISMSQSVARRSKKNKSKGVSCLTELVTESSNVYTPASVIIQEVQVCGEPSEIRDYRLDVPLSSFVNIFPALSVWY